MPRRHEDVVRQLMDELARGEYAEGARLPAEHELALRLGTGRGAIREALLALEAKGMVGVRPGHGAVARPDDRWRLGDGDVLLATLESGRVSGLLREAIDARTALERDAAHGAGERATAGDLRLLRERVEAMERATAARTGRSAWTDDAFVRAEGDFHHALSMIGGNRVIASIAEPMHVVLATLRLRRAPDREAAALAQHRRILEGASSGEPELAVSAVEGYGRQLARWLAAA
jgi:GntR family transcriptional repressor for pyruvate dehydrogenase complex